MEQVEREQVADVDDPSLEEFKIRLNEAFSSLM